MNRLIASYFTHCNRIISRYTTNDIIETKSERQPFDNSFSIIESTEWPIDYYNLGARKFHNRQSRIFTRRGNAPFNAKNVSKILNIYGTYFCIYVIARIPFIVFVILESCRQIVEILFFKITTNMMIDDICIQIFQINSQLDKFSTKYLLNFTKK